jgi:putative FmdB family regulatory protein
MPIYEYACTACGRSVEVVHGVHAAGPEVCEVCGGRMRKLVSTPSIHFKGSGWAKKDARDGARQRAEAGARDAGERGAGSEGTEKAGRPGDAAGSEAGAGSRTGAAKEPTSASKGTDAGSGPPKAGASD